MRISTEVHDIHLTKSNIVVTGKKNCCLNVTNRHFLNTTFWSFCKRHCESTENESNRKNDIIWAAMMHSLLTSKKYEHCSDIAAELLPTRLKKMWRMTLDNDYEEGDFTDRTNKCLEFKKNVCLTPGK